MGLANNISFIIISILMIFGDVSSLRRNVSSVLRYQCSNIAHNFGQLCDLKDGMGRSHGQCGSWNEKDCFRDVLIGIFITRPTPFLEEFFLKVSNLEYPKMNIHVFLYNNVHYHAKLINEYETMHFRLYKSFSVISTTSEIMTEFDARHLALIEADKLDCEFYLSLDSEAHLDNPSTLTLLIEESVKQKHAVIAPMLVRPFTAWSNFWGSINLQGYYARSANYMDIVKQKVRGVWNVPFITEAYIMHATIFGNRNLRPKYLNHKLIPQLSFCLNNRRNMVPMYISNVEKFGHLVNSDNFVPNRTHTELYAIFNNQEDWKRRYLHEDWEKALNSNVSLLELMKDAEIMPCPDVFWVPMVTPRFCAELIEEMESFGQWFDGSNIDYRVDGGAAEDAPTVDIHMKQIGMGSVWLQFLRLYVQPLQAKLFMNDYPNVPTANMSFVVRYKPDEQAALKPHHDKSLYTVNIALNLGGGIDFEGGGCRFVRYNCTVPHTKLGYGLFHPGKLTHEHEGLRILRGKRYVLVSFVNL